MNVSEINHDTGVVTISENDEGQTVIRDGEKTVTPPAAVEMPPEEEAAMKFTRLLPFVTKLANALPSKGGVVRVLTAVAEFPVGGRKPRLLNEAERQLFHVMMELNGYKTTVVSNIMQKNAELEKEKQTALASTPAAESEVQNG